MHHLDNLRYPFLNRERRTTDREDRAGLLVLSGEWSADDVNCRSPDKKPTAPEIG
jgi:hypothetical protein